MADTKLSDLSSGAPAAATDIIYAVKDPSGTPADAKLTLGEVKTLVNTPGGSDTQVQFNDGGAFAGDSGFTFNKTSKALTLTGASITTSSPVIDAAQTWNASGTTFTGLKLNVTDTLSASASLLMDIGTGGGSYISKFKVDKNGAITSTYNNTDFAIGTAALLIDNTNASGQTAINLRVNGTVRGRMRTDPSGNLSWIANGGDHYFFVGGEYLTGAVSAVFTATGIRVPLNRTLGFTNEAFGEVSPDLFLTRRAAANLRLGAADAAGSAISISSVASNQLTLASNHGLTSGAAVQITGTAAPSGTTLNVTYYARVISAAVLELYDTYQNAVASSGTTGRLSPTTTGTSASVNRAAPFQTLSVQSFTGTDIPGQPFVITGSQGTGTGAGGSIIFQVAPAGSSGTAQNALADALTITSARAVAVNGATVVGNTKLTVVGSAGLPGTTNKGVASFLTDASVALTIGGQQNSMYLQALDARSANGSTYGIYLSPSGGNVGVGYFGGGTGVFAPAATLTISQTGTFGWDSGNSGASVADLILVRDATNTLALRNGGTSGATVPQTFNLYEYWATASDYSRVTLTQSSVYFFLQTQAAGSGTKRGLILRGNGTNSASLALVGDALSFGTSVADYWTMSSSGHLLAGTDNTYDIGAENGTGVLNSSPRNVISNRLVAGTNGIRINGGSSNGVQINQTGNGVLRLANWGVTDFDRLQFGGTTSSFPALKRSTTTLQVRLADDSGDADLSAKALTLSGNLTISTKDIVTDTTTGTKIGTGTTQKIGFYNKTPVVQPTAVADATDAATVITQLNALLSRMRDLGLIAT